MTYQPYRCFTVTSQVKALLNFSPENRNFILKSMNSYTTAMSCLNIDFKTKEKKNLFLLLDWIIFEIFKKSLFNTKGSKRFAQGTGTTC